MNLLDGVIKEFLIESRENLDQVDRDLANLELVPENDDRLSGIYYAIHTVNSTCKILGFRRLEKVTAAGVTLLSGLRSHLVLDPERVIALVALVGAVRAILRSIDQTGRDEGQDYPELIEYLTRLQEVREPPHPQLNER